MVLSGNVKSGNIAVLYKNKLKDTARFAKKPRIGIIKIYVYDNSSEGLKISSMARYSNDL